ncbi:MAG: 4-hydroxythreonine-4-phosphate dehydrogenase PdxA [Candidatus Eisenbacteria bacterium]
MRARIALCMGDIGGIGPEISLRTACSPSVTKVCEPVIVGDSRFLRGLARRSGITVKLRGSATLGRRTDDGVAVVDVGRVSGRPATGRSSREAGRVAGRAIEEAVRLAVSGDVAGIVTAPVSKESLALAGYGMVGHTELIARLTGSKIYGMMILRGNLRIVFATSHVALRCVAGRLTKRGILNKLKLTRDYLNLYMGIPDARIGVTCLNPHCGEGGRVGREEQRVIEPAIRMARDQGICADGPYPADSIYRPTFAGRFDAILAMYHDQGMIALRQRGHDDVVNITLGIPCVRTSPGHGTAFDIVGKCPASEKSMVKATLECVRIAKRLRHAG